jgi:TolB protein
MDADGSHVRRLTKPQLYAQMPAWSPDGRWIAFLSTQTDTSGSYIVSVDSLQIRQLTNDVHNKSPLVWSPDGTRIAYTSYASVYTLDIFTVDLEGNVRQLTANAGHNRMPAWSPDGQWIAFSSDRDNREDIYVMDRDGNHLQRVTWSYPPDYAPVWRP